MRHREAWAVEKHAPSRAEWERQKRQEQASARSKEARASAAPARRPPTPVPAEKEAGAIPRDILIVASKLKTYIRARSGMNTSESVMDVLSDRLRKLCDEGIRNAERDGRKTVMDRDFKSVY
jgi:hypothetical protein